MYAANVRCRPACHFNWLDFSNEVVAANTAAAAAAPAPAGM
jgi:hypothetical protein